MDGRGFRGHRVGRFAGVSRAAVAGQQHALGLGLDRETGELDRRRDDRFGRVDDLEVERAGVVDRGRDGHHRLPAALGLDGHVARQVTVADVRAEQLLHVVVGRQHDPLVVEENQVRRRPLGVAVAGQQRGVGGHRHHVGVALHAGQIRRLGQCVEEGVAARGVLADVDFRPAARELIEAVAVGDEPLRRLVVVFVADVDAEVAHEAVNRDAGAEAAGADDRDFGVRLAQRLDEGGVVAAEQRGVVFLVAEADVFEVEGRGVAHVGADLAPGAVDGAVGELDEVDDVPHPLVQIGRPARLVGRLEAAAHGDRQDRQRGRADVLGELEILEVAKPVGLVIAPAVGVAAAPFDGADGVLPAVRLVEAVAVDDAAAGEAQGLGVQVGNGQGEILAQTVGTALEGVGRHQRDHVEAHAAARGGGDDEPQLVGGARRRERRGVTLPFLRRRGQGRLGDDLAVVRFQRDAQRPGLAAAAPAGEERGGVSGSVFDREAVVTGVGQARLRPRLAVERQVDVVRVVRVQRPVGRDGGADLDAVGPDRRPRRHAVVGHRVGRGLHADRAERVVLERAVLHEFRVKPAVGGEVDVLEEDAVEGRGDWRPLARGVDGDRRRRRLTRGVLGGGERDGGEGERHQRGNLAKGKFPHKVSIYKIRPRTESATGRPATPTCPSRRP